MLRRFLVSWFLGFGFKVSKFQGFENPLMLLKDIDLISKIFMILLHGSMGFVGAHLF